MAAASMVEVWSVMKTFSAFLEERAFFVDLEIFTDKIGESGRKIIRRAYEAARSLKHAELFPEHVLIAYAEVEPSRFEMLLQRLNLEPQVVLQGLSERLGQGDHAAESMKLSKEFRTLLHHALKHAKDLGQRRIEASDLLIGIFSDSSGFPVKLFKRLGVRQEAVLKGIDDLKAVR
jgi:ATP-dependent Clp protease ATP-binding subunit ClpA